MRHAWRTGYAVLLLPALLLAWLPPTSLAGDAGQTEYRVKAALLYNFARFVTWPDTPAGPFTLCILGADPLREHLDILQNKTVHERKLRIMHLTSLAMIDDCQLVYIGSSYTHKLHDVLSLLKVHPVLTVSDIDDFIASGGIIGFRLIDNKVRFEINTDAAVNAGLSISSKLLTLATTVRSVE